MVQVQTEKDLEKQPAPDQLDISASRHEVAVVSGKYAAQNLHLKKSLFVALFGFFLLVIAVITLSILLNMRASRASICTSKSCIRAANLILENMDQTADPCEDFYQFTCGSFLKTKRIKDEESKINEFSLLRDKLAYTVADLLSEPISDKESNSTRNAKALFQSCMDEGKLV